MRPKYIEHRHRAICIHITRQAHVHHNLGLAMSHEPMTAIREVQRLGTTVKIFDHEIRVILLVKLEAPFKSLELVVPAFVPSGGSRLPVRRSSAEVNGFGVAIL